MKRKPRVRTPLVIAIEMSPQAERALRILHMTGLYGFSVDDVAERLFYEKLREVVPAHPGIMGSRRRR